MSEKSSPCRFGFITVFILGMLGVLWTGRYYYRKESHIDRDNRSQRIAAEMKSAGSLIE